MALEKIKDASQLRRGDVILFGKFEPHGTEYGVGVVEDIIDGDTINFARDIGKYKTGEWYGKGPHGYAGQILFHGNYADSIYRVGSISSLRPQKTRN